MWANRRIVNRSINADHDKNREFETAYGQRGMVVCASIVNWSIAQKNSSAYHVVDVDVRLAAIPCAKKKVYEKYTSSVSSQ